MPSPEPPPLPVRPALGEPTRRLLRDPRVLLLAYGIVLTLIAVWPVPVDQGAGRLLDFIERIVPVLTYSRIEFAANVVLFVPLGVLLTLILSRSRYLVLPIAFVTTVAIESVQAVLLSQRVPSVLDVIANTAGACIGLLLVAVIQARRARRAR